MEMISEILKKYDTDKVNPHTYGSVYDNLFSEFDRQASLNILEIGTQKGGSLCAWKEYFPNATITGIDIVDVVNPKYKREDFKYVLCDINEYKTTDTFDIVIDDGSHWLKDVVHSVSYFSQKLNMNGIMVVEDVQNFNVWFPTINNLLSSELDYNKGYVWLVAEINMWLPDVQDNCLSVIKRIQ